MRKRFGVGSLSMLLVILALLWSCNFRFWNDFCLGDFVLGFAGLPAWSHGDSGTHYTVWYALILLIPAFVIGWKNEKDLFAVSGKWISGIIGAFLLVSSVMMLSL